MRSTKRIPKTIDEYLVSVNAYHRDALQKIRATVHAMAPNAEECISYGIPAFRMNGRSLVFFGAWANYCALYPGSSATLKKFRNALRDFQTSKGTLRFSPGKPLPVALVKRLVKTRIAENNDRATTKRRKP
jgi:uncharacterized protein YdhG (YjbR/CyaY superfamily)